MVEGNCTRVIRKHVYADTWSKMSTAEVASGMCRDNLLVKDNTVDVSFMNLDPFITD